MAEVTDRPKCSATTAAGAPCGAVANVRGDPPRCVWHDPARQAEADEMRQRGNRARAVDKPADPDEAPPPPKTLDDVVNFASWLAHAVTVGVVDVRRAREAAYTLSQLRFALEKRDLQVRVRELEARVAKLRKGRTASQ